MYHSKVLAPQGGILKNGGNGTFRQKDVPKQYQLNIAEPGVKSVGVLRGASASAAPIVAVNKERYDNRSSKSSYETKTTSENMLSFWDFRDAMKQVSGTESSSGHASLKPEQKPVPTHSKPLHTLIPLIVQSCIDMNYGKDNVLYDNTSNTLKFSTPANGRIVPVRKELFGMFMDDLHRIENGDFPVHSEWFNSYGTKMTPSKAKSMASILERISRLIQFTKENNTWIGKGTDHIRSIMNALLVKNLLVPKTYNKQKYFSFFYHLNEQSYDDYQGRAIRGETKPPPLQNALLPPVPFPNSFLKDVLVSHSMEREAARQDLISQAQLANIVASSAVLPASAVNSYNMDRLRNGLSVAGGMVMEGARQAAGAMSTAAVNVGSIAEPASQIASIVGHLGISSANAIISNAPAVARGVGTGAARATGAVAGAARRTAGATIASSASDIAVGRVYDTVTTFQNILISIGTSLGNLPSIVIAMSAHYGAGNTMAAAGPDHDDIEANNGRLAQFISRFTPIMNRFRTPEGVRLQMDADEYMGITPRELIRRLTNQQENPLAGTSRRLNFTPVRNRTANPVVDIDDGNIQTPLVNGTPARAPAYLPQTPGSPIEVAQQIAEQMQIQTPNEPRSWNRLYDSAMRLLESVRRTRELNRLNMILGTMVRPGPDAPFNGDHITRIIDFKNKKIVEAAITMYEILGQPELGINAHRTAKNVFNAMLRKMKNDEIITPDEFKTLRIPGQRT